MTFVDYYELLEISPRATAETIERIFRYFAKRYHPDNRETGDERRFGDLVEAHNTLRDPATRAQYDILYGQYLSQSRELTQEASDPQVVEKDSIVQARVLSLLCARRRQDVNNPGIGDEELERLSGCPREHLEFHLWYLKAKGFIGRTENGTFAVTVQGIDRAYSDPQDSRPVATRLLENAVS
ncbi:J domain-containing protein [Mesorhizobium sp. M2D.F.Ca.ET.185.01.1.1]|uniref:DnaJ domain-containing protein n=1 Tax=unclassified Mesorhizobium TaxID=325217 RepID=UPI000FCA6F17|nr:MULTISPECIES: J domain-containing protein [unclassified Mesorhizobium]TGP52675.1 J domain-containing protein [bacterium M00.F.Ca.ET.230.01.1.1]TGP81056.1 J domain-containing protein [bacterium M00.F.Ca.ET.227.01.1.1]TGP90839.1 J domain-containing protein [bacterium M00.F.Ca.ET.221.01.1.1]TGP97517.1 J domain-containing protein [bacterium M00.F.Ca.ET.222.01.1.1]TGT73196.1 J domain-containing protein [bacterium M00.F.Ca.ET.159.01.1.1]TGT84141.1 J domain-containing protein [bacterium M00.F.Ca.